METEPYLATASDMLRTVYRFYSHPRAPDANLDRIEELQMSRTDLFQFLVECDLLQHVVRLGEKLIEKIDKEKENIKTPFDDDNDDEGEDDHLYAKLFETLWSTYSLPLDSPSSSTSFASSSDSSSHHPLPAPSTFSFESFADLCYHLSLFRASHLLTVEDLPSPSHSSALLTLQLSPTRSAGFLIHLLEHDLLPNSSLYNPRSLLDATKKRWKTTPLMALFIWFHLPVLDRIYQHTFASVTTIVAESDRSGLEEEEYRDILYIQWRCLLEMEQHRFKYMQYAGIEESEIDSIFSPLTNSSSSSSSDSFGFPDFLAIMRYKHRYDPDANTLRHSVTVTFSVFIEIIIAATQKYIERRFNHEDVDQGADSYNSKKERQAAQVEFIQTMIQVMEAHI